MLEGAFLHFKGIGNKKLIEFNSLGVLNWEDIYQKKESLPLKNNVLNNLLTEIEKSREAIKTKDLNYLVNKFHKIDRWRILFHYLKEASFFDIETDGIYNRITLIACYHRGRIYKFLRGDNLENFLDLLDEIKLAVTFNGASFDIPVILREFHIPEFPAPHIDLRWVLYHEGFKGGLKSIEQKLGIYRPIDLVGVDGWEAVNLWIKWIEWGDRSALEKLERYCAADVISLLAISEKLQFMKLGIPIENKYYWDLLT